MQISEQAAIYRAVEVFERIRCLYGVTTFKNSKIDQIIKDIPLEKIVLETDAPFLTPDPYRKFKNEPKYIRIIAEYLAELKHIDITEVENITTDNVFKIFSI